jgi:hypothetical protein
MGGYTLFYGMKHFRLTLIFLFGTLSFFTTLIGLSATGHLTTLEESIDGIDFGHGLTFGVLGLSSSIAGSLIGNKISQKVGLTVVVAVDIAIVSTAVYMFLISFTGKWHVILIIAALMTSCCLYVSLYPAFQS